MESSFGFVFDSSVGWLTVHGSFTFTSAWCFSLYWSNGVSSFHYIRIISFSFLSKEIESEKKQEKISGKEKELVFTFSPDY